MLVIERIEAREVPYDSAYVHRAVLDLDYEGELPPGPDDPEVANWDKAIVAAYRRELVLGRRLRTPGGKTVWLGFSEQAAELLDVQFEAWRELEKQREGLRLTALRLRRQRAHLAGWLDRIRTARWWTRCRWVFTGV